MCTTIASCRKLPVLIPAISHSMGPVHAAVMLPSAMPTPDSHACAQQYGTIIASSGTMVHSKLTCSRITAQLSPESIVFDALPYGQLITTSQPGDESSPCIALASDTPPMSCLFRLKDNAVEKVALHAFDCNSHSICVACAHGLLVQVTNNRLTLLAVDSGDLLDVWKPETDQPQFSTTRISNAACALPQVALKIGTTIALLDVSSRKAKLESCVPICAEVSDIALLAVPQSADVAAAGPAAHPLVDSERAEPESAELRATGLDAPGQAGLAALGRAGLAGPGQAGLAALGRTGLAGPGQAGLPPPGQAWLVAQGQTGLAAPGQIGLAAPVQAVPPRQTSSTNTTAVPPCQRSSTDTTETVRQTRPTDTTAVPPCQRSSTDTTATVRQTRPTDTTAVPPCQRSSTDTTATVRQTRPTDTTAVPLAQTSPEFAKATVLAVGVHDCQPGVHLIAAGASSTEATFVPTPSAGLSFVMLPAWRPHGPATLVIGTISGVAVLVDVLVRRGRALFATAPRHLSVGSTHVTLTVLPMMQRGPLPSAAVLALSNRALLIQQTPRAQTDASSGASKAAQNASAGIAGVPHAGAAGPEGAGVQSAAGDGLHSDSLDNLSADGAAGCDSTQSRHTPANTGARALGGRSMDANEVQELVCPVATPDSQMHPTAACALPDGRLLWTCLAGDVVIGALDSRLQLRQTSRPLASLPRALTHCTTCNAVAASVRFAASLFRHIALCFAHKCETYQQAELPTCGCRLAGTNHVNTNFTQYLRCAVCNHDW
jgi:hypothetical protein